MEPQQLATKVAQLESRVASLEDEGKIVKGEVKQILTEIRTAILVRDNPFEGDGSLNAPAPSIIMPTTVAVAPAPPPPSPRAAARNEPERQREDVSPPPAPRDPVPLRPIANAQTVAAVTPAPQWSLLTIAGLAAWAEEAMKRLGSLRLEILLDLCEAAGHITPDARIALARVTELDIAEPDHTPSTNETTVILRQLDALVNDEAAHNAPARLQRI